MLDTFASVRNDIDAGHAFEVIRVAGEHRLIITMGGGRDAAVLSVERFPA